MVTLVNPLQSKNAPSAIPLVPAFSDMAVPFGMVPLYLYATSPAYRSPSGWLSYQAVPENALLPILVTELGMVTLVNPLQPLNALPPILVTELGMVTLVKPEQPLNAEPPMVVTE